jgi:hypothetical protein
MKQRQLEVPGSRWRILAHDDGRPIELENQGILDEVVIDDWMHLEQTSDRQWWMRVGDARMWINIDADGNASVEIERGFYEGTVLPAK